MSMCRRFLISDLDGTLLNEQHQVSSVNKKAIQQFVSEGNVFTIATGRMLQATLPFINELSIKAPVILGNGTQIYCPKEQKLVWSMYLKEHQNELITLWTTISEHAVVIAYDEHTIYTPRSHSLIQDYEAKERVTCLFRDVLPQKINKVLIIGRELEDAVRFAGRLNEVCIQSDLSYLEILPAGASKGQALHELLNQMDVEVDQVIAVGDQMNDYSLLEAADYGYAVENAHSHLKGIATHQTIHHTKDAVASIIFETTSLLKA
ncbi:HAD family hydrolase [Alkalicoccobacillus gibsonii]|uniref:HAD family hydrolase n=1 Tax=Alkalicoccobacillus gibsonii TaxID=79881 RepID=UPI003F7B438F